MEKFELTVTLMIEYYRFQNQLRSMLSKFNDYDINIDAEIGAHSHNTKFSVDYDDQKICLCDASDDD